MKKLLYLVSLLSFLLVACSAPEDEGRVLHVAYSQDVPSLDVMRSNNRSLRDMLVGQVYERLFVLDEDGNITGELAEEYRLENEGRRFVATLRSGVPFHDGTLMEPEDVVCSLNRWIDCYEDAARIAGTARFEVSDDGEVVLEAMNSLTFLPYLLASSPLSAVIMPKELCLSPDDLVSSVVGTGPYMLSGYEEGHRIVLERFPSYVGTGRGGDGIAADKKAYADRIEYLIVPDSIARRIGLERGEYDYINDVMSQDIPAFEKNGEIKLYGGDESGSIALVFNKRTADPDLRKAVDLAIDPDSLMKACYGDYGYALHEDYMEKGPFSVPDPGIERGVERAREFIEENDLAGRQVRILVSNLSNLDKIAVVLADELEQAGLDASITVLDWAGFLEKRNEGEFEIMISAFSSVPLPVMKLYLSPTYPGWYSSETSEAYLESFLDAPSMEEAVAIWNEAQEFYYADLPVIVPGHYMTIHASSSDLEGVIYFDGAHLWNARKTGWEEE